MPGTFFAVQDVTGLTTRIPCTSFHEDNGSLVLRDVGLEVCRFAAGKWISVNRCVQIEQISDPATRKAA